MSRGCNRMYRGRCTSSSAPALLCSQDRVSDPAASIEAEGEAMFLLEGSVVYSASDLAVAADCEFGLLRRLDAKLDRLTLPAAADAMLERTARLGDAHEDRVLARYLATHGHYAPGERGGVAAIAITQSYDRASLEAKQVETVAALLAGAEVVVQGSFFDGRFHGRSDFIVRRGNAYAVYDTKLARHAKITALLQLAAYADQLLGLGIPVHEQVGLMLGDYDPDRDPARGLSMHQVKELIPVYLARRARLQTMIDEHHAETDPVAWGDSRYARCGRCEVCAGEVAAQRDVLLVAGMRLTQRANLRVANIFTIDKLAASSGAVPGLSATTLARLREQAALQLGQEARPLQDNGQPDVEAVVFDTAALAALPPADRGDIFFDFEGDPLWSQDGSGEWGLEYLFGVVEADTGSFVPFWAHDRRQEKAALVQFLGYVCARSLVHPGMHIYHYASYERSALLRLAGRHGVGEKVVDDLLRQGVLVDLYSTVRQSVRVSQPSYSIKKLEPIYMGDELRGGDVTSAAESLVKYALACDKRDDGDVAGWEQALASIAEYNQYDCLSTLRLCRWLREQAVANGVTWDAVDDLAEDPGDVPDPDDEPEPLEMTLLASVGDSPRGERTSDQQAYAMLAASLGYHRREDKPFWWAHFDRLSAPVDEWAATRDVFLVESAVAVIDWDRPTRRHAMQRTLELKGEWGPGSTVEHGPVFVVHSPPLPEGLEAPERGMRATSHGEVQARTVDAAGREVVTLIERLPRNVVAYPSLPMALTPTAGPASTSLVRALTDLAEQVVDEGLGWQPGLDVLRRIPPRTASGGLPAVPDSPDGAVRAITDAVVQLDHSYLAVQGPPGTGKTHVGARVVKTLVERGWRIGVVAQSHAVVEHFLDAVVDAGLAGDKIAKESRHTSVPRWTSLEKADHLAAFLGDHATGCVVGGTAWDFTNLNRVQPGQLDLVVIDEAGQFALANTLAVSTSAQRLLLLGDPQQLPQVSQGTHPEPVNASALGWLNEGHATLPNERGYFLETSWRMHSAVCERVSLLSYDGRLRSYEDITDARHLDGVEPGLHVIEVIHQGNSVASPEEAARIVQLVSGLIGRPWTDPADDPTVRPLGQPDLLVVAAYNAQVALLHSELARAGFPDVRVGTVDKLQGQEAPVVLVSMAASSPADVPRGMEFLLSRNRVNVAVSRGQWAAIVVRSPLLTDYLPRSPEGLAELGAFIRLTSEHDMRSAGRT